MVGQRNLFTPIRFVLFFVFGGVIIRIFISCSDASSDKQKYVMLASEVATLLAHRGHKLIFSGKLDGMMEKSFMTFKYEGAKTKAILDVQDTEVLEYAEVDAYDVLPTTFQKNESIYKASEVLLLLPGGMKTVSEFLNFIEEKNTRKSNISIILYNAEEYYTPLLHFFKEVYKEGFVKENVLKSFDVITDLKGLEFYIEKLEREREENYG